MVAPTVDPRAIARRAMAEYDSDKNGFLDVQELERCPGLKSFLENYDRNKDDRLS
jgi:hypothetical protein